MVEGAMKHLSELATGGDFTLTKEQISRVDDLCRNRKARCFRLDPVSPRTKADASAEELQEGY
jgi:hypothetical protein